jgi:hypothetical protein
MRGRNGLMNVAERLHFGQVTVIAVSRIRMVRQVTDWLRATSDLPAQLPIDLACTRHTNCGLQESAVNSKNCQKFVSQTRHADSGKTEQNSTFLDG